MPDQAVSSNAIVPGKPNRLVTESTVVRIALIAIAAAFLVLFLILPLVAVFQQALVKGLNAYFDSFADEDAQAAIKLSLYVTAIAVPFNLVFGLAASWSIAKFEFTGKSFLLTLIDIPFSVSPVVSGLIFILLFGAQGYFAPLLRTLDLQIVFATPGIVLATIFVTLPLVARQLIPLMQEQGPTPEDTLKYR